MVETSVLVVRAQGSEYPVVVGAGLIRDVGQLLRQRVPSARLVIIYDRALPTPDLHRLTDSVTAGGYEPILIPLLAREEGKSLRVAGECLDAILAQRPDRRTPVVAFGGGITGDLAGFVAATLLRGVPLVQIPTTLLAMVDASVGGKVGVNHGRFKNMIGAFKQPEMVLIDPETLRSLPPRHLRAGLAECVKHAVLADAELFRWTDENVPGLLALDDALLAHLVLQNVRIKAQIVERDPLEAGERAVLNLGHTFGHAIESVSDFRFLHGEAVGLGLLCASRVAVARGQLDPEAAAAIERLLRRCELPVRWEDAPHDQIAAAMRHDKKAVAGRIRLVLPVAIGRAEVIDDATPVELETGLEALREGPCP